MLSVYGKRILYAGVGDLPSFPDGSKLVFHYAARLADSPDSPVIDDTRRGWPDGYGEPLELVLGKKFKVPAFETCLRTMRAREVASFLLPPAELLEYPFVSKQLRDISRRRLRHDGHDCGEDDPAEHTHCAGMMAQTGYGYPQLDALAKQPQTVQFTFELLEVVLPDAYKVLVLP